jgi:CHAD domain-containing protein
VLAELPDEFITGPVAAHVTRILQRRRAEGLATAIATLDSDRYLALHDALGRLLKDPPLNARAAKCARRELALQMGRSWRRLDKRMRAAESLTAGRERDLGLHETRKAGKRLRYADELAQPDVGKKAKRLKQQAKNVHKLLGDHQDPAVARPIIRELAVQAFLHGGNGFTYGILHELETRRAENAERDLPSAWKRLRKPKNIKWLQTP